MAGLPKDIADVIRGDKSLGESPLWDDKSDPRYHVFTHPLTVVPAAGGYQLRVKVSKRWVDRDALMQLEYMPGGKRTAEPLWRLDWKPFHTHTNDAIPPSEAFRVFEGSHQHAFTDNYLQSEDRMRVSNLPAGSSFLSDPNTLSDFLARGGELFRIKDIGRINLPVSGADLFWKADD